MLPIAAAIANAVHDGTGVRITQLPLTPQSVYAALLEHELAAAAHA
jgi:CO/xanthine dehydrogenase Mo-binding subunit